MPMTDRSDAVISVSPGREAVTFLSANPGCNQRSHAWAKKSLGSNFPTDGCKFPIDEITGARNFNFAPKFRQNGGFPAHDFVFLEDNFSSRKKFSYRLLGDFDRCKPANPGLYRCSEARESGDKVPHFFQEARGRVFPLFQYNPCKRPYSYDGN